MQKRGVYAITHVASARCYVGSSVDIRKRWNSHRRELKLGIHPNRYLQRAWDKHGEAEFAFTLLELVKDASALLATEQRWIDILRPDLNLAPVAGSALGVKLTAEARAKIAAANRRRGPWSAESREKLAAARRGVPTRTGIPTSDETRRKISEANRGKLGLKGRVVSAETRARMSEAAKRRRFTPEQRAAMSERRRGKKRGPYKVKPRPAKPPKESKPRAPQSAERRAELSSRMKGVPKTPEQRAKMAEAARRRWADPSEREKLISAITAGLRKSREDVS